MRPMNKKLIFTYCSLLLLSNISARGQHYKNPNYMDYTFAVKTNLPGPLLGNINVAGELLLTPDYKKLPLTLNLPVSYNPFTYRNNVKLKHIAVQPELRMWFNRAFRDFYIGAHAHYAYYNAGGISRVSKKLKEHRYQGNLFGGGISGGYKKMLGNRFGLEGSLGLGYAHMSYDEFRCAKCGTKTDTAVMNYFGLTKTAIAIVYMIN